jgi:hypothetical protein
MLARALLVLALSGALPGFTPVTAPESQEALQQVPVALDSPETGAFDAALES